jgi:hypothetical protein
VHDGVLIELIQCFSPFGKSIGTELFSISKQVSMQG